MKIMIENNKGKTFSEYAESEIKKIIDILQVACGVFGDDGLRCLYLVQADNKLKNLIVNLSNIPV